MKIRMSGHVARVHVAVPVLGVGSPVGVVKSRTSAAQVCCTGGLGEAWEQCCVAAAALAVARAKWLVRQSKREAALFATV